MDLSGYHAAYLRHQFDDFVSQRLERDVDARHPGADTGDVHNLHLSELRKLHLERRLCNPDDKPFSVYDSCTVGIFPLSKTESVRPGFFAELVGA